MPMIARIALCAALTWPGVAWSGDDLAGMVDPRVTQDNIRVTICRRGYTRTVRPPREVTDAIKRNLAADQGIDPRDYELDHIVPLDLGGDPADLRNLRLQPWPEARCKDMLEIEMSKAVCMGSAELIEAQREMAHDWRAAYAEWINPRGCE